MNLRSIDGDDDYTVRVLLVDDQNLVGAAIERALAREAEIAFHHCLDSARAVAAAEEIRPTVILQDLVMPDVDGLTLVRIYRQHPLLKSVPIIVLSGEEQPAIKSASFQAGANDYLVKLPDSIELVARLRYHSRSYLNQQQRDEAYRALRDSERRLLEANAELHRLTSVDGLTGLRNRRSLDEYFACDWDRDRRESVLSLLMVDVDDFKRYNDAHGHVAGDEVLRRLADVIHGTFRRPADLAVRFGGEEFVVVLPATPPGDAVELAEALRQRILDLAIPHRATSGIPLVTISVGVAATPPESLLSPRDLIEVADAALYEAKHKGKNRVVRRDP